MERETDRPTGEDMMDLDKKRKYLQKLSIDSF